MIQSIEKLLSEARVARFDPEDGTLSSGERAQAKIVTVLLEEWDALDGKQQRTIVDVLELSLIHISEPTRREWLSRMPSSA